jgi:2,4-dienoyl-CoA reductase (NADPH2)
MLDKFKVDVRLNTIASAEMLQGYEDVVIATGVQPRKLNIEGANLPNVLSYAEAIRGAPVGMSVAVIGAGGIGFDVSELLLHPTNVPLPVPLEHWQKEWGVETTPHYVNEGGLMRPELPTPFRKIFLLQRKDSQLGKDLGKTSGWVHRATLKKNQVKMIAGVSYDKITAEGLWITANGQQQLLRVDTIVVCAGQESVKELMPKEGDAVSNTRYHIIGGAKFAGELDAKRAIREGSEVAAAI